MRLANFQTGPVAVSDAVREAMGAPPVSHRDPEFGGALSEVAGRLLDMTNGYSVALRPGGGTLANDMIAAQLSGRGVIVSRGEFGQRLQDHARGAGLEFSVLSSVPAELESGPDWIWAVHCETSTGEMADLAALRRVAEENGALLCLDCVSSIGAVDLDLSGVHLASFSSGKGLASVAGVCGVFAGPSFAPRFGNVPRCLDMTHPGIPSTFPSGPLFALRAALAGKSQDRTGEVAKAGVELRSILDGLGVSYLLHERQAPHVVTVTVPDKVRAHEIAADLAALGVLVSAGSDYLVKSNWLQIAVMGNEPGAGLEDLRDAIGPVWP